MSDKVDDYLLKPAIIGATAALGQRLIYGSDLVANVMGKNYDLSLFTFGAVALSSMAAEAVHDYVLPHIEKGWMVEGSAELVAVSSIAGTDVLLHYLANARSIEELGIATILLEAAGARVVGGYIHDKFVSPMYKQMFA